VTVPAFAAGEVAETGEASTTGNVIVPSLFVESILDMRKISSGQPVALQRRAAIARKNACKDSSRASEAALEKSKSHGTTYTEPHCNSNF
jgi:hypothetical protein